MNYCTFEQFQGVWLGSIASILICRMDDWEQTQKWLAIRSSIAKTIINSSNPAFKIDKVEEWEKANLERSEVAPLILLPLIIFSEGDRELFKQEISQYRLSSAIGEKKQSLITVKNQEELLIWSYLLFLTLNYKFELQDINIRQMIKRVLTVLQLEKKTLVEKMETVIRGWEKGLSLYQLTEELLEGGNLTQSAIALSCYCFATTPQDFQLSVKRASNLNPKIAYLSLTLTATLSGAYNGVAGIPRSWRAIANQNPIYQQEQQRAVNLFKTWLGIYSWENDQFVYDGGLHAVARANTIQPRIDLKIISQKSYLS